MTKTEELLEAVCYASESGIEWWECFDTKKKALLTVRKAAREIPEEHQVATMLAYTEVDNDLYESLKAEHIYDLVLRGMKTELQDQ